ncbi:MAG TPA: molybdenum cofactor guanylyltransferase MobA [Hyphomicrobiales bacterium]|nr:molybdenum cofactor guanylyltransferase MobA [Kaistiaceae bacterium]HQF30081.1 molybdenum cofactor guanylyltransferase MobA [Hyphomicrobiales bacterium]
MNRPFPHIAGIVLAGGRSTRMGGHEKALLDLAGRPMLAHVVARVAPQVARLAINANGDPARLSAFGLAVVADTVAGHAGPLAGLLAGLEWAKAEMPDARALLTVAADTPFLPADLVTRLEAASARGSAIVLARSAAGLHPVIGLWPVALADDLALWLADPDNRKVRRFVDRHPSADLVFADLEIAGTTVDPFFNVNTPGDLATAASILERLA